MTDNIHATIFIGSLKDDSSDSNTANLAKIVSRELKKYKVSVTLRYLANRHMAHGVDFKTDDPDDQAEVYFEDIHKSDILILATPIWWGIQSSLCQQWMERVGAYDDQYITTGKSPLYNKVFGCIVTGSNDGFQHIHGNFYNFASELGMTIPPEAHVDWGTILGKIDNEQTMNQVKNASRNLFLWSKMIKSLDLGNVALSIKPGRVGITSQDKLAKSK